jgi:hypothetical protein
MLLCFAILHRHRHCSQAASGTLVDGAHLLRLDMLLY